MPEDFEKGMLGGRLRKKFRFGRNRKHQKQCRQSFACVCPNCRLTVPSKPQTPCFKTNCPRCGATMVRLLPGIEPAG